MEPLLLIPGFGFGSGVLAGTTAAGGGSPVTPPRFPLSGSSPRPAMESS